MAVRVTMIGYPSITASSDFTVDIMPPYCTSLTKPAHGASKTYTVNDIGDKLDVGAFTSEPTGCQLSYSTTVSPTADFMTQLQSGRGMEWYTNSEANVGTYTVTVTATSNNLSESTSYTVTVRSQFCTSLQEPSHEQPKIYVVGD